MKKLVLGLMAAFLMSFGFVAVTSSAPSQAACGNPQYPACFSTTTSLRVAPGGNGPKRRAFTVNVKGVGTNADPVGTVSFRFKRVGSPASFATRAVPASGQVVVARTFGKKGTWNVSVSYSAKAGSVFKNSKSRNVQFKVG